MSAADDVTEWTRRIQRASTIPERLADAAAPGIQNAIAAQVADQAAPDGSPWPETYDGHPALQGAMGELAVVSSPVGIALTLDGPSARHDQGRGHAPRRQVLPDAGDVPETYRDAINEAFTSLLEEAG